MQVNYRFAKEADVPGIAPLWEEGMAVHAPFDPRFPLCENADELFVKFIHAKIIDPDAIVLVAEMANTLVGYCLAHIAMHPPIFTRRPFGYIDDLMVSSLYRRRGIGQSLFNAVAKAIRSRGVRNIEVSFMSQNDMSRSFWRKLGFITRLETARLEFNAP
ncbi:MAG: GNAT family N-acetyltransferase [Gammaproteobacteria bacterium]|nr:GNAT family N-acetyltransferase [Gammaproteobacteria bacterium]